MSPKKSLRSLSDEHIAITVGCSKRFKKAHRCTPRCFTRTAQAVLDLASAVQGTRWHTSLSGPDDLSSSGDWTNERAQLGDMIVNALAPSDNGGADADLLTLQLGGCSAEVSRRRHVDGMVYGGTVELITSGSLWEAFAAAGRVAQPVREAGYFRVGQFQVESRKLVFNGELLLEPEH